MIYMTLYRQASYQPFQQKPFCILHQLKNFMPTYLTVGEAWAVH